MRLSVTSIISDYQIIVTIIMVLSAWKWGDWRHWRLYYPTMLFFALGDITCGFLTYNYPLWEFESPLLKTTLSDLLISLVFFPATVLLYLPHFPKKIKKQVPYILLWVLIYTAIEHVSYLLGFFSYHNGWNIWWSVLFNSAMFPILRVHHKKPLLALFISMIAALLLLVYFKIPMSSLK